MTISIISDNPALVLVANLPANAAFLYLGNLYARFSNSMTLATRLDNGATTPVGDFADPVQPLDLAIHYKNAV